MQVKIDITGKNITTDTQSISADDKESKDDLVMLYKRYCECRDKELDRFWKTSAFVWTFLGICFAADGILITKFLDKTLHNNYINEFPFFNSFICIIGFILSLIWLRMAKAEKVWYEIYEMAIWEIESYKKKFNVEKDLLIHNFWTARDRALGTFSPSKLVLAIGYVLMSFWCLMFVFGIYFGIEDIQDKVYDLGSTWIPLESFPEFIQEALIPNIWEIVIVFGCIALIGFAICLFCLALRKTRSSEIRSKDENEVFHLVRNDSFISQLGLYFEVKNKVVSFFLNETTKNENLLLKDHYNIEDDTDKKDIGNIISFEMKKILHDERRKN